MARKVYKNWTVVSKDPPFFTTCPAIILTCEDQYAQQAASWQRITRLLRTLWNTTGERGFEVGQDVRLELRDRTLPKSINPFRVIHYQRQQSYVGVLYVRYQPRVGAIPLCEISLPNPEFSIVGGLQEEKVPLMKEGEVLID